MTSTEYLAGFRPVRFSGVVPTSSPSKYITAPDGLLSIEIEVVFIRSLTVRDFSLSASISTLSLHVS